MKYRILNILCCPVCSGYLDILEHTSIIVDRSFDQSMLSCTTCFYSSEYNCETCYKKEITDGTLQCSQCSRKFVIHKSVPYLSKKPFHQIEPYVFEYFQDEFYGAPKNTVDVFYNMLLSPDIPRNWLNNKIILDAGCGDGQYLHTLKKDVAGGEYIGCDITPQAFNDIELVNAGNVHLVYADLSAPPFRAHVFDYIFSISVLSYIKNPKNCLHKLLRSLKNTGVVTIGMTPHYSMYAEFIMESFRKVLRYIPRSILFPMCYLFVPILFFSKTTSGANPANRSLKECAQLFYVHFSSHNMKMMDFKELKKWMRKEGCIRIFKLERPAHVCATKHLFELRRS